MDLFGALSILNEERLFLFEPNAIGFLRRYLRDFGTTDEYENQFRSNIGSVAAAEVAILRQVLNGNLRISLPQRVIEIDTKIAIVTADTLRTRPCRTAARTRVGEFSIGDLFMFSGEASKAWFVLDEGQTNISEIVSPQGMLRFGERLYGSRLEWERQNLSEFIDAGLERFSILFAYIRLNTLMNRPHDSFFEGVLTLRRSLGL
jgi:hypothetical protein